jgi:hypothetical protein
MSIQLKNRAFTRTHPRHRFLLLPSMTNAATHNCYATPARQRFTASPVTFALHQRTGADTNG